MTRRTPRGPIITSEDLDATARGLVDRAGEIAAELRASLGIEVPETQSSSELEERFQSGIREAIRGEFTEAVEAQAGDIEKSEFEREILKKAILGLGTEVLRQLAREKGLRVSGRGEMLADRVARAFDWKLEDIALAASNYDQDAEVDEDRQHVSRLFVLDEDPSIDAVQQHLDYVTGRYVKIALARWFVFERFERSSDEIRVDGSVRSYQASILKDESGDAALSHDLKKTELELAVTSDERVVRVDGGSMTAARTAVSGFSVGAMLDLLGRVPGADFKASSLPRVLSQTSDFLLDLIYTRFAAASFSNRNLTIARFKVADSASNEDESRPVLRAVRFEGAHLLDSVPACQLLYSEGRPLVEIGLTVAVPAKDGTIRGRFPVRVAIESDHVLVTTGYGTGAITLSTDVHEEVVAAVASEISDGIANPERLEELTGKIQTVATTGKAPEVATALRD